MYTTEQIFNDAVTMSYRHYKGEKTKTLFLFHGFGQTNDLFKSFIPSVLPCYSVIAVDLFFHGESRVEDNSVDHITIDRWNALFEQILLRHQIDRFSMLSYSMGSRFVVTLLNTYAYRINKIVLIAPDGFGNNFWFNVATSVSITRAVFRYTMHHPLWLQIVVRVFGVIGIFNSITKRFIERNLESAEHRKKIYNSWVYFRKLVVSKKDFVEQVRTNNIRVMCFCGREDQLVAKDTIKLLSEQSGAQYIELELAHHKMVQVLESGELNTFLIADRQ